MEDVLDRLDYGRTSMRMYIIEGWHLKIKILSVSFFFPWVCRVAVSSLFPES